MIVEPITTQLHKPKTRQSAVAQKVRHASVQVLVTQYCNGTLTS